MPPAQPDQRLLTLFVYTDAMELDEPTKKLMIEAGYHYDLVKGRFTNKLGELMGVWTIKK